MEPDNHHPKLVCNGAFVAYRRSKDEYTLDMISYYDSYSTEHSSVKKVRFRSQWEGW